MGRQIIKSYKEVDMITVNKNMKEYYQQLLAFVIMLIVALLYAVLISKVQARGHVKHWGTSEGRYYGTDKKYTINCRLKKQWIPKPQIDPKEPERKCEYKCTDGETTIITTHLNYSCMGTITEPRTRSGYK